MATKLADIIAPAVASRSERMASIRWACSAGSICKQFHLVRVRQDGEEVGQLRHGHLAEDGAGPLAAEVGDDLPLRPRLGLHERFRRLLRIQGGKDRLLLLAGELFQGVGQVLAGQFPDLLRVIGERDRVAWPRRLPATAAARISRK